MAIHSVFRTRKRGRPGKDAPRTYLSFTAADLAALGHYVAVGVVVTQTTHPVVTRLKAALTRMKLPQPKGL
jgi:hypothetical protein